MTQTIIQKNLSLIQERDFNISYPKSIELGLCRIEVYNFSVNIKDYNIPLYNTIGYFDSFTLGDLDSLTLGEMDYNL